MPSIGPWAFTSMSGRILSAAPGARITERGIKHGPPVPYPSEVVTVESLATFAAAWSRAVGYRRAVGACARLTDDGGLVCDGALIADCRVSVEAGSGGATLRTRWTAVAPAWYGRFGFGSTPPAAALDEWRLNPGGVASVQSAGVGITVRTLATTLTFQAGQCDIHPPLLPGARAAVQQATSVLGGTGGITPSQSGGTLAVQVAVADEAAAARIVALARSQIGSWATIEIGGAVQIAPCAVANATGTWAPAKGMPNGTPVLVSVEYEMQIADGEDPSGEQPDATVAVVQVGSLWGTWADVPGAFCTEATEGLGGNVGSSSFAVDLGSTMRSGRTVTHEPSEHTGKWMRIQVRVDERKRPHPRGSQRVTVWHGVVGSASIDGGSIEGGAVERYTASGLGSALDAVFLHRWYEVGQGGDITDPGEMLPVNDATDGDQGVLMTGVTGGADGVTVTGGSIPQRAHDRIAAPPARWTINGYVASVLAAARAQFPGGPLWKIGGQIVGLGQRMLRFEPNGRSALGLLSDLISPKYGMTFRVEVDGAEAIIRVCSTVGADFAPFGPLAVPANDKQGIIDLSGAAGNTLGPRAPGLDKPERAARHRRWSFRRSHEHQVDSIRVELDRPIYVFTARIHTKDTSRTSQFVNDWSVTLATEWDAAEDLKRSDPPLDAVHRRFVLDPAWNGRPYTTTDGLNNVLPMTRATVTDAAHGVAGESGKLTVAGVLPQSRNVRMLRTIPVPSNLPWSSSGSYHPSAVDGVYSLEMTHGVGDRQPVIVGEKVGGGYESLDLDITVDRTGGAVILGRTAKDASSIKAYLAAGNSILLTIAIEGVLPWRVGWNRADAERPRDLSRSVILRRPSVGYTVLLKDTVESVDGAVLKKAANEGRAGWLIDPASPGDGSIADYYLALALAWHKDLHLSLTWDESGRLDLDAATAIPPGGYVSKAVLPLDPLRPSRTHQPADLGIITSRAWSFAVDSLGMSWSTDRVAIDIGGRTDTTKAAPPVAGGGGNGFGKRYE